VQEAAPGAALPSPGPAQGALRGNQGQRDERNLREGRPADVRGGPPGRDQRGLREGGPGAPPPNALGPSGEGRRGPQAGGQDFAPGAALRSPGPPQGAFPSNQGQRDERNLREGRPTDVRGGPPGRDQRGLREGGPGAPPTKRPWPLRGRAAWSTGWRACP
jgi:hypothetical protein